MSIIAAWPAIDVKEAAVTALVWKGMGYETGILVHGQIELPDAIGSYIVQPQWIGFPTAANMLCAAYGAMYDIVIIAGSDIYPDQSKTAQVLEAEFKSHFNGTNGIMHPTGDRYGLIDDVCICPWIGAEYIDDCSQAPYYDGYYHYFCDAELQEVAIMKGRFWQRPDLSQYHDHWGRKEGVDRPEHLLTAKERHPIDQQTYLRRKANGYK